MSDNPNTIDLSSISEGDALLIKKQLKRVLSSHYFKLAEQQQKFLSYIIEQTLNDKGKQLKQYTIAVEGLSYAENFDSDTNPVIRVIAGRIRKKLEDYNAENENKDILRIALPKGGYLPSFTKCEVPIPLEETRGYSTSPKLAVVCFSDKTQDQESNRLLFHVSDTLVNELSQFLFSRVVVSIPHCDRSDSINAAEEIQEKFQAEYMLVFCIQQLPQNQHLLLCRIQDVYSQEVIWSDTYDLDSSKPFHKHYKIIASITAVAADVQQGTLFQHWTRKLLEDESSIPEYFQAITFYRNYTDDLGIDTFKKGVQICKNILEKNPNDVISNVLLAEYCRRNYVYDFGVIDNSLEIGKKAALNAIRLQPDSHEAHYVLGQIFFCFGEKERAINEFGITRDLFKYHAYLEFGIGLHLIFLGQAKKGMELVNDVLSLSSNYPSWFNIAPFCDHFLKQEYDKALCYALKIDAPILFSGPMARCMVISKLGNYKQAQKELSTALKYTPDLLEKGEQSLARFVGSKKLAKNFWEGLLLVADAKAEVA